MGWTERVSLFNSISAEERAELVRTHISRWLSLHRHELTGEQIAIIEENIAFIRTDLYTLPRDEELVSRYLDLAKRTAKLLSRDQARDALTMYWDRSCATATR
jgi:translation elongation factor EF-Ts